MSPRALRTFFLLVKSLRNLLIIVFLTTSKIAVIFLICGVVQVFSFNCRPLNFCIRVCYVGFINKLNSYEIKILKVRISVISFDFLAIDIFGRCEWEVLARESFYCLFSSRFLYWTSLFLLYINDPLMILSVILLSILVIPHFNPSVHSVNPPC